MKNLLVGICLAIPSFVIADSENDGMRLTITCQDFEGFSNTLIDGAISREKDAYSNQIILLDMDLKSGTGQSVWAGRSERISQLAGGMILESKGTMLINFYEIGTEVFRTYTVFANNSRKITTTISESQLEPFTGNFQGRGFMSTCTRVR